MAVLVELLEKPGQPRYGLEIAERADIGTTTVYDILMRLEQSRWIKSQWESVAPADAGRPRRRLYQLTGHGERSARAAIEQELKQLHRAASTADVKKGRKHSLPAPAPGGAS
jgi:PadR family transcriptional regulator, regulatory protein PadR